jgi:carboxylesterase
MTEPLHAHGGDIGCLLIHGFSGSPVELRPLADALATQGYMVHVPLLPGHGATPEALSRIGYRAWIEAVRTAREELEQRCRTVVVVGYSMGGLLAIVDSARRPPTALALLGVPTFVDGDWRIRLLPVFKYLMRWWYPLEKLDFADPAARAHVLARDPNFRIDDPLEQARLRRSVRISTAAIDQFFRLARLARGMVSTIDVPTLIVHGRHDTTAVPACAEELHRSLASRSKQLRWFEASGHELVIGPEGAEIVDLIVSWIGSEVAQAEPSPTG